VRDPWPKRRGARGRAHSGRGSAATVARNAAKGSSGPVTGTDKRPRGEGRGVLEQR
jgi:hypothetical protein